MTRTLDFADHRRDLGSNRYVYAVVSRRARGLSIGVNLNPDKVCNFDCPYCPVDRTTPGAPPDVDVDVLAGELDRLLGWVGDR
ncbi:MAG: radical SAM protein, partial [Myxococcota bacterium]